MFVRDLERFGITLAEIDATEVFPATAKVVGYIRLQTDVRGPAPAALWDWYLEWYSDRYIPAITEAASREFGTDATKGASAHLGGGRRPRP